MFDHSYLPEIGAAHIVVFYLQLTMSDYECVFTGQIQTKYFMAQGNVRSLRNKDLT